MENNFYLEAEEIRKQYAAYAEKHGMPATATAYMEEHERPEPVEWVNERRDMYRALVEAAKTGMTEGIDMDEIRETLYQGKTIPKDVMLSSVKCAGRIYEAEEREHTFGSNAEERKEEISKSLVAEIREAMKPNETDTLLRNLELNLFMMKIDKLRSILESGRNQGLHDQELMSIAVAAGLTFEQARTVLDNGLQNDVDNAYLEADRSFKQMEEQQKQQLEMEKEDEAPEHVFGLSDI